MNFKRIFFALVLLGVTFACSCSALVAAYLINQLLDEKAPKKTWSGHVYDHLGDPVAGVTVEVHGSVSGDSNIAKYSDGTDVQGFYSITYRWNDKVEYSIHVLSGTTELASIDYGKVEKTDRVTDINITGSVNMELSGIIRDGAGQPLSGVLVVGASAAERGESPAEFKKSNGKVDYDITNAAGIFALTGSISKYGIICAYHPDHGFAYRDGEDLTDSGSIDLSLAMGNTGTYNVRAQVVDATSNPVASQVLSGARQFRLRLQTPWNMAATIDKAVAENGLFPGLSGEPGDDHPSVQTLIVQATGANGFSTSSIDVPGSSYEVELLNINDNTAATALVLSDNPLALYQASTVLVRVN
jgi:hypothetical protein